MSHFLRDVVHAVHVLASRPVLTATTVATLAIGIGGTSTMFAVADSLLLRPLPVPDADRLVRVFGASDINALGITSYPNLQDVADRARSFSAMTIHQQTFAAYGLGDETTNAAVELVSGSYFPTFRVATTLGRALTPDDDRLGAPRVAVVSDRWWRSQLARRSRGDRSHRPPQRVGVHGGRRCTGELPRQLRRARHRSVGAADDLRRRPPARARHPAAHLGLAASVGAARAGGVAGQRRPKRRRSRRRCAPSTRARTQPGVLGGGGLEPARIDDA